MTAVAKKGSFNADDSITFDDERWEFVAKLGSGRFATVHSLRCVSAPSKQDIAAKVTQLHGQSSWARSQLHEELAIWQNLRHPNVLCLYGHLSDATRHVLLLELA